jgi:hypothetical protein
LFKIILFMRLFTPLSKIFLVHLNFHFPLFFIFFVVFFNMIRMVFLKFYCLLFRFFFMTLVIFLLRSLI